MDSPSLTVEQVERLANPALLNRYLSVPAVAVASLIYDHIRFLDTEISDVWVSLGTSTRLKLGFLVGRYAADAALLYTAYVTLPLGWSLAMILTARIFHRIGLDKKRANEPPRAYLWHQDRLIRLTY
ncbi:hypothetical protein D9756_003501 [Leucocoprinus leucothites]|uniref:Uncharacterized protein n=1 Tax=Leucocoprinus leucothites TaxID=201217 RepID=A0A8H5LJA8_9AGAR|nr:hypothetical protein D9756_003501 [Leucoagaricus leucothites]